LQDLLEHILENKSDELERAWQERVGKLAGEWDEQTQQSFVRELLPAVKLFIIDKDLPASRGHIDAVLKQFSYQEGKDADLVIKALLILRYVLLGEMIKREDCAVSSMEVFGYLNDLFNPLIIDLAATYRPAKLINRLPENFAPSCVANLQSLKFAGVGFFVVDASLNLIYWSRGVEEIYGLTAESVIGCNIFNALPQLDDCAELKSALTSALQEKREKELFSCTQQVDGKKLILDIKCVPMLNEQREIIGCSMLVHDVTKLKKSESRLHRYEQYFENILNDAADAIVLLDEDDHITLWNKAAESLFGYKEKQVIGQSLEVIFPKDKKTKADLAEMNQTVREQGVVRRHRVETVAQDGHIVLTAFTRTRLRNEKKEFIGSSVILRDITQQEQLRQQVVHSEKLSAVGTLAAGIAHEVGTPLTSISSLAQIMQMKTDDEEFKAKLALIQQSIDRISRTVRTLVDFSRPATEKIESVYLNSVVDHVLRIIKYDKRLKHQQIITLLEPNIGLVRANFDQVLQVLINICLNAADAMEGKKDGVLEVKTWNNGKYVCARVRDNGGGIKKKHLSCIFDPFFTTKTNGKGTGLGLWVSYNIIKSFSGDIKVESDVGKGTSFTIILPRQEP